jgi:DNA-binding LacI/PurR family transcriptional regulator
MADAVLHLVSPNRAERAIIETGSLAPCIVVAVPYQPSVAIPQYYWDEADGARDIAAHLAGGHRSVAILAGGRTEEAGGVPERVQLLVEALDQVRVQALPIWDEEEIDPVAQGSAGLARAVSEHPEVTAVIGRNDRFTLGAYLECLRQGIAIPGQISLLSFVDTVLLTTAAPFITAVRSPLRDAAVEAARTLVRHVSEGAPLEPSRKWRPTLEVRSSTSRL